MQVAGGSPTQMSVQPNNCIPIELPTTMLGPSVLRRLLRPRYTRLGETPTGGQRRLTGKRKEKGGKL